MRSTPISKNNFFLIATLCLLLPLLWGCGKDPVRGGVDVYLAGTITGKAGTKCATYWKNGVATTFTEGSDDPYYQARVNALFISGNNIYLGGGFLNNNDIEFVYWKNGIPIKLKNAQDMVNSLFVSGNDVYTVSDNISYGVKYLKNGSPIYLSIETNIHLSSIKLSGNDIFIAGWDKRYSTPKLWKNEVPVNITYDSSAFIQDLFISGSDVYLGGWQKNYPNSYPTYWKNGTPITLTDGDEHGRLLSIYVNGNDVYAAGYVRKEGDNHFKARYWKNGVPVKMIDDKYDGYAASIRVINDEVYVALTQIGPNNHKVELWKNGSIAFVSDSTTDAVVTSMEIIQR